jgi:inosose dehydratase
MEDILIGCGQLTWPRSMSEGEVLGEIAQAGYDGAPAGPRGGRSAEEVIATFAEYGLKPAPGYLSGDFWEPAQRASILEQARAYADFSAAAGCTELYVAAGGFDSFITPSGQTRRDVAGHVGPNDGLSAEQYDRFAEVLNEVGQITLAQGVRSCFHNHVGSVIETREEIDQLFNRVDRTQVFMGPDTGHLAWGGVDVVSFCRDYLDLIKTMHIKDIDSNVLKMGRAEKWNYRTFSDKGIFIELGRGFVDFPAVFELLSSVNFSGWLIVETDVTQRPTALESAEVSRAYLKSIGL